VELLLSDATHLGAEEFRKRRDKGICGTADKVDIVEGFDLARCSLAMLLTIIDSVDKMLLRWPITNQSKTRAMMIAKRREEPQRRIRGSFLNNTASEFKVVLHNDLNRVLDLRGDRFALLRTESAAKISKHRATERLLRGHGGKVARKRLHHGKGSTMGAEANEIKNTKKIKEE